MKKLAIAVLITFAPAAAFACPNSDHDRPAASDPSPGTKTADKAKPAPKAKSQDKTKKSDDKSKPKSNDKA